VNLTSLSRRFNRSVELTLHRLQVGHGLPEVAAPLVGALTRWTSPGFWARERQRLRSEAAAIEREYRGRELTLTVDRAPKGPARPRIDVPLDPIAGAIRICAHAYTPEDIARMTERMSTVGLDAVRGLPIRTILDVLDRASLLWLDPKYPPRALAVEAIHRITGFSREMVLYSIDLEMRSSRRADLWHTLWTELGNPSVLDGRGWSPTGEAPTAAFGPTLVSAVFSSNIPALPHLTYMRGLAVKAPVIGKVATFEPVFAGLYVDTLRALCPELGESIAAIWFPGGSEALERSLMERAEYVIAYGSEASLASLSSRIPPNVRRTMHGHRMGIGCVDATAAGEAEVQAGIAFDVAVFDGQACLAPAVYFVEGQALDGVALARRVGAAIDDVDRWLPRRALRVDDRAARRSAIDEWELSSIFGGASSHVVRPTEGLAWAGLVTSGTYRPEPHGDRMFHIHCVDSLDAVPGLVEPYRGALQNVAIAAEEGVRRRLGTELSRLGASRVTKPGLMPTPSMMWHHDGRLCLADLLRWSDIG